MRRVLALLAAGQFLVACAEEAGRPAVVEAVRWQLASPEDGVAIDDRWVVVRGRVEADEPLARISYRINGVEKRSDLPLSPTFDMEMRLPLDRGSNLVEVVAESVAGAEGRIARTITSTARPPAIEAFTASATGVRPGTAVDLAWTVDASPPFSLELAPVGEVAGSGARVRPERTTTYRLVASNTFGTTSQELEVEVLPELVPQLRTVAAGSSQSLWVAGVTGTFRLTASGGSVTPEESDEDVVWQVPETPGTYELRVEVGGDADFVHEVVVTEARRVGTTWTGSGGQPDAFWWGNLAVAPGGGLWAVNRHAVLEKPAGGPWHPRNEGLDFLPLSIAVAADGTPWLLGYEAGSFETCAIARFDTAMERWVRSEAIGLQSGNCRELRLAADGSQVVFGSRWIPGVTAWRRSGPDEAWVDLPVAPPGSYPRLVGPDGSVYASCIENCLDGDVFHLAPGATQWQSLGTSGVYPTQLAIDPAGSLVAGGYGIARLGADGTWVDETAGLLDGCGTGGLCVDRLKGMAFAGAETFVLTDDALFVRGATGSFRQHITLPGELVTLDEPALLENGSDDLWVVGLEGIWRLPAGEALLAFEGSAGLPGSDLSVGAIAARGDGLVALASQRHRTEAGRVETPLLALRDAGADDWRPADRGDSAAQIDFGETAPVSMVFDGDGSLLLSNAGLYRIDPSEGRWAAAPRGGLPEGSVPVELVRDASGAVVGLVGGQPYRLDDAAGTWNVLPEQEGLVRLAAARDGSLWGTSAADRRVHRLGADATSWHEVGAGPLGPRGGHVDDAVQWGADGTAWAPSNVGVVRLEGDVWRQVGGGPCGWRADSLLVTRDGRVLCSSNGGVYLLDSATEVWEPLTGPSPYSWATLRGEAPGGRIWVMTDSGLFEVELAQ